MSQASCHHPHHRHAPAAADTVAIDPVCGMKVSIAGARHSTVHQGRTWYFCNPRCLAKFIAEPARYLPFQLHVLDLDGPLVRHATVFFDTAYFTMAGLPAELGPEDVPAGG